MTVILYLLRFGALMLVLLPLWLLLRRPRPGQRVRETALALFVLYLVSLLALAWQGRWQMPGDMLLLARQRLESGEGINLRPLYTVRTIWRYGDREMRAVNLTGNVVMFLPYGFGLPLLWRRFRRLGAGLAMCLLLTAMIETVQLFIGRSVDVDDLLLNLAGGVLGWGIWAVTCPRIPRLDALAE